MRRLDNPRRVRRLIDQAIAELALDLSGMTVLTEAASGPFVCTPLIAALAGAQVRAVTRSSSYGQADEVTDYCLEWAGLLGVRDQVVVSTDSALVFAEEADIITNLGFVRPITADFVARLPKQAAIPLMWEPWEFRAEDLDLAACRRHGIPVVGTCETDSRLRIFDYVGATAMKLLFEAGIEVVCARVGIVASSPFGEAIQRVLEGAGAMTTQVRVEQLLAARDGACAVEGLDALVLAEHRDRRELVGCHGGMAPERLVESGVCLIHIAGNVDDGALKTVGLAKYPVKSVPPGYMTVTTDYVGPRPVIDLHAAGLKVGEILVRAKSSGATAEEAELCAVASGLGLSIPEDIK